MWIKEEKDCAYEWNKPEGVSEEPTLYIKPHIGHAPPGGYAGRHLPHAPPTLEKAKQSGGSDEVGSRVPLNVAY